HGLQAVLRAVQARKAVPGGNTQELSRQPVRPSVIGTGDGTGTVPRLGLAHAIENARAAMTTDVVKGVDLPVRVANGHHAVRAQIQRHEISGRRDGVDVTDDLPTRFQDALVLEPCHLWMAVRPRG